MAVNILNVKTAETNVFWADDSIRLVSQPIPANHELFAGMKTQSFAIPGVGLNGIFATQGDISTLTSVPYRAVVCRVRVRPKRSASAWPTRPRNQLKRASAPFFFVED